MAGTNDVLKKSFSILFPDTVHGNFVSCKTKDMCYCKQRFTPPLANLNRLSFQFYAPDGTLVDFGTDNASSSAPNVNVQVILILEITTVDSNRAVLESRPIW